LAGAPQIAKWSFYLQPYSPESDPDEYLNHGLKLSVHLGNLPFTTKDISHKIRSFMRSLLHNPFSVSRLFLRLNISYLLEQK